MRVLLFIGFLAASLLAGLLIRARIRLARLRALLQIIEADPIEEPPESFALLTVVASLTDTTLRLGSEKLPILAESQARTGDLLVSEWGLVLRREALTALRIPHARILDALIVRSGADSPLRITWERGGQTLDSWLLMAGGIREAERVRREIHLRAKRIPLPKPTSAP